MSRDGNNIILMLLQLLAEAVCRGSILGLANNATISWVVRDRVATSKTKNSDYDGCCIKRWDRRLSLLGHEFSY